MFIDSQAKEQDQVRIEGLSAQKLQSTFRGHSTRKKTAEAKKEREEKPLAAT